MTQISKFDEKTDYLKEMLTHQTNLMAGIGSLVFGALISLPFGLGVGLVPVLAFLAIEGVAALFVPDSPLFKHAVDSRIRKERREMAKGHLYNQLFTSRGIQYNKSYYDAYASMRNRLKALKEAAENCTISLGESELEKLDDATNDFLGLCLARSSLEERYGSIREREVKEKIASIEKQIAGASASEKRSLSKAKEELNNVLIRRSGISSKMTSLDAKIIALSDTYEEVYQSLISNPHSTEAIKSLGEAVEQIEIEKNLELEIEEIETVGVRARR